MRVSVREEDPGYDPRSARAGFKILLDGEDVTAICHTADEEQGRIWGYAKNEQGHRYIDPITDLPAEHTASGHVEIIEMMNGARNG